MSRLEIGLLVAAMTVISASGGQILNVGASESASSAVGVECVSANCSGGQRGRRLDYYTVLFSSARRDVVPLPDAVGDTVQTEEPPNMRAMVSSMVVTSDSESDAPIAFHEGLEWTSAGRSNPIVDFPARSPLAEGPAAADNDRSVVVSCGNTGTGCGNTSSLLRIDYTSGGGNPAAFETNSDVRTSDLDAVPPPSPQSSAISVSEPSTTRILFAVIGACGLMLCVRRRDILPPPN